jgi:general secretion pathway protein H
MPTFATRTSSRNRPSAGQPRGFTFIELLVVVTLVAILTGTVVLGFTGADTQQEMKGFAQRFGYRIELARQQALQRNREWGVYVDEQSYRFAEYDPDLEEWLEQTGRPFAHPELPAYLRLRLETEGVGELPFADGEAVPRLLVFSSGEITPFTLYFSPEGEEPAWQVSSDGLSRSKAQRESEAEAT